MKESKFQKKLINILEKTYSDCIIMKNDPTYIQGIPDLLILYKDKWVALECKDNKDASHQPNQDDYVEALNKMSYSSFVYPENLEEVLNDIQRTFEPGRKARSSRRK